MPFNIQSREVRRRLEVREKPYFARVTSSIHLGYRKGKSISRWVVRWRTKSGYRTRVLEDAVIRHRLDQKLGQAPNQRIQAVPAAAREAIHSSLAGALVAAQDLPRGMAQQVIDGAQETFAHAAGVASLVGAALLLITSILVWTFQHRDVAAPAHSHARQDLVDVELNTLPALVDGHAAAERGIGDRILQADQISGTWRPIVGR